MEIVAYLEECSSAGGVTIAIVHFQCGVTYQVARRGHGVEIKRHMYNRNIQLENQNYTKSQRYT